ncbi:hypothetical protein FY150_17135 [Agrobacterium tumefaciens]|jgi:hypothetical protein|nr:hypothetical protein FY150_17135 [Agrobacterium tumefaciens]
MVMIKKGSIMPVQTLGRGLTANLGANVVAGTLHVVGVATPYTISINGGAAVAHVAAVGVVDNYAINGQSVSITNTTPNPGPDNLTLSW